MRRLSTVLPLALLLGALPARAETLGNLSLVSSIQSYSVDDRRTAVAVEFVSEQSSTVNLAGLYLAGVTDISGNDRGYRLGLQSASSSGAPDGVWLGTPIDFSLPGTSAAQWMEQAISAQLTAGTTYFLVLASTNNDDDRLLVVGASQPEIDRIPSSQLSTRRALWQMTSSGWSPVDGVEPIFLVRFVDPDPALCGGTYPHVLGNPYHAPGTATALSTTAVSQTFAVSETFQLSRLALLLSRMDGNSNAALTDRDGASVAQGQLTRGAAEGSAYWYRLDATADLSAAKSPYKLTLSTTDRADWVTSSTQASTDPCSRYPRATFGAGTHFVSIVAGGSTTQWTHQDAVFRLTVCRPQPFYPDADGDGWGAGAPTYACALPQGHAARDGDCDDTRPAANPDAAEQCNGLDDDCDGRADEELAAFAPACAKVEGVCEGARARCGGVRGWLPCTEEDYGEHYQPSETRCDGRDNDCDGQTDNGLPATVVPACALGEGICAGTTQRCVSGAWAQCGPESYGPDYLLASDPCDGLDNDCDGVTDEDPVTEPCGRSQGVCAGLVQACVAGALVDCRDEEYAAHSPDFESAGETRCDGLDNDCDGAVDDLDPQGLPACGEGVCATVRQRCEQGALKPCDAALLAAGAPDWEQQETRCDGLDNDCDGAVDDLDPQGLPACGEGVCATVHQRCEQGALKPCDADLLAAGSPDWEQQETRCDGLDNDCDGVTDPEALCRQAPPVEGPALYDLGGCGCGATGSASLGLALLPLCLALRRPRRRGDAPGSERCA